MSIHSRTFAIMNKSYLFRRMFPKTRIRIYFSPLNYWTSVHLARIFLIINNTIKTIMKITIQLNGFITPPFSHSWGIIRIPSGLFSFFSIFGPYSVRPIPSLTFFSTEHDVNSTKDKINATIFLMTYITPMFATRKLAPQAQISK